MTQTEATLPKAYEVCDNEESDIIYLSWKTPTENAVYYPNSTWTTGRNRLIEEVKNKTNLLRTNKQALIKFARETYYMKKENEVVYLFK